MLSAQMIFNRCTYCVNVLIVIINHWQKRVAEETAAYKKLLCSYNSSIVDYFSVGDYFEVCTKQAVGLRSDEAVRPFYYYGVSKVKIKTKS